MERTPLASLAMRMAAHTSGVRPLIGSCVVHVTTSIMNVVLIGAGDTSGYFAELSSSSSVASLLVSPRIIDAFVGIRVVKLACLGGNCIIALSHDSKLYLCVYYSILSDHLYRLLRST